MLKPPPYLKKILYGFPMDQVTHPGKIQTDCASIHAPLTSPCRRCPLFLNHIQKTFHISTCNLKKSWVLPTFSVLIRCQKSPSKNFASLPTCFLSVTHILSPSHTLLRKVLCNLPARSFPNQSKIQKLYSVVPFSKSSCTYLLDI